MKRRARPTFTPEITLEAAQLVSVLRSSYKYWAGREHRIKPEKIEALAVVINIYRESNSSASAITVSGVATLCLWFQPVAATQALNLSAGVS